MNPDQTAPKGHIVCIIGYQFKSADEKADDVCRESARKELKCLRSV